jgi:phage tail sheath gpL-like
MAVNFNQIPNNIRSPLAYIEVNASNANAQLQGNNRILVLGQMLTAGTATANNPVLVSSYPQAVGLFGQGSMLANMFFTLFQNNTFTEKWALPVADNGSGVAAVGTLTLTGPATATGVLSIYLGGVLVSVPVAVGDTATTMAASVVTAIGANLDLPVSAASTAGVVTITYKNKGTVGNAFDLRMNYSGSTAGEVIPTGVTATFVQLASGATDPVFTTAIGNLPEQVYDLWCHPYGSSSTILTAIETELNSRWSPLRMLEGHSITAAAGSVSTLVTLGDSRNNPHQTILDAALNSPSPSYLWAAALVGQTATSTAADPGRPLTTLPLVGILPPPPQNQRLLADKNTLLYNGIATHMIDKAGNVMAERIITTYQTNSFGVADGAWLDITTPMTLSYFRQAVKTLVTNTFARKKLADDGTRYGAGVQVVTPSIIKSALIALAGQWVDLGLMEDMQTFKDTLIVVRNDTDPTRVDVVLPPNLVNPLYIFAASLSFVL